MKYRKRIISGMTVSLVLFGLLLAGCITMTPVAFEETEFSKEIFNAISNSIPSNIVTSNPANPKIAPSSRLELKQKTTIGEIISLLTNKFPGMNEESISGGGFNVTYQGKSYYISCDLETTGLVSVAGKNSIVLSIFSVKERSTSQ